MRGASALLVLLVIAAAVAAPASAASYTPVGLVATVYPDGLVGVEYTVDADPLAVRTTIPLFGSDLTDLLVVNQNGLPLVTTQTGSTITIDSLGATNLTITYSTQQLTSKLGNLWTLNVTSPTNLEAWLPAGATIVSMSQMPLGVSTIGGRIRIILPPGADAIDYVVSPTITREAAQAAIADAEATIVSVKANGTVTTAADSLIAQAKTAFDAGDYSGAYQLATQAKSSALATANLRQSAQTSLDAATAAIQKAQSEGRTSNIASAESLLSQAQSAYSSGDYPTAKSNADMAASQANSSRGAMDYMLIAGAAVLVVAVVGVVVYARRRSPTSTPAQPTAPAPKPDEGAVKLELVFQRNPDLRVDDKEVVRFLAERGGEAFANEIRDRFDIPRTSAWRMIRRLISAGIVEERKIGGQSLIHVAKKYREAQEK